MRILSAEPFFAQQHWRLNQKFSKSNIPLHKWIQISHSI